MAEVLVVDYGVGNVYSVMSALKAAAPADCSLCLSDEPDKIKNASHIILPGVGAFEACYQKLAAKEKTFSALSDSVQQQGKPFLGICVGAQLMVQRGLEYGQSAGLGWLGGESAPLENKNNLPLPHMGWNSLSVKHPHPVLDEMDEADVYFANSFAVRGVEEKEVLATSCYGDDFCAAFGRDNLLGAQFHPEKSQTVGLAFLERFIKWQP